MDSMVREGVRIIIYIILTGLFVIFAISFAPVLIGSANNKSAKNTKPEDIVRVSDIVANPIVYSNLNVDIKGHVASWVSKRAFALQNLSTQGLASDQILVIRKEEFKLPENTTTNELALGETPDIRVKGQVVQSFDVKTLEAQWGVTLAEDAFTNWQGKPAIILSSVEEL